MSSTTNNTNPTPSKPIVISAAAVLLVAILGIVWYFAQSGDQPVNTDTSTDSSALMQTSSSQADQTSMPAMESPTPQTNQTPGSLPEEVSFDITMDNYSFTPDRIAVRPGQKVTLNLTSTAGIHDFVIDELSVKSTTVQPGQTSQVTFEVPENVQETYQFYCSVGNHKALGQVGTVEIVMPS